jgi:predicted DCC family thiol-disulfide oxidoreductase YuxK
VTSGPVLIYDGVCGLCNWTVRVVLRLDRRGRVRFAPLQGTYAAELRQRHPELGDADSLVLVERRPDGERVLVKSDAVLRLAHRLGGVWRVAAVGRLVPRALRDWVYDGVARHRYAIFGRLALRPSPPAHVTARFLE